jgi:type IV pilus assembly protein PilN
MGRLVEQRRDAKTSRVELLTPDASIEEFPVSSIKSFFSNIELKDAVQQAARSNDPNALSTVDFNITLSANYAI